MWCNAVAGGLGRPGAERGGHSGILIHWCRWRCKLQIQQDKCQMLRVQIEPVQGEGAGGQFSSLPPSKSTHCENKKSSWQIQKTLKLDINKSIMWAPELTQYTLSLAEIKCFFFFLCKLKNLMENVKSCDRKLNSWPV